MTALNQMTKNKGIELVEMAEKKIGCGGICTVPLFFTMRDISIGKPEEACVHAILEELTAAPQAASAFSIVTGLVLILSSVASFPLCSGFSDDMGDGEEGAKE